MTRQSIPFILLGLTFGSAIQPVASQLGLQGVWIVGLILAWMSFGLLTLESTRPQVANSEPQSAVQAMPAPALIAPIATTLQPGEIRVRDGINSWVHRHSASSADLVLAGDDGEPTGSRSSREAPLVKKPGYHKC
jgi:hypothetical protein